MQLPKYSYKINEHFYDYEFISEGPKGSIKKIVHFTRIAINVFNIGFGDLDETSGRITDKIVTNNSDSRKVLATVAFIIYDFLHKYPEATITAKGSTASRTRLYRIGITNHINEIGLYFVIYGLRNNNWEPFINGKEYDAFLIRKK